MEQQIATVLEELRKRGHKVTWSRRMVLEAIVGHTGTFTAEEICARTARVGRATVYRTIKLLVDLDVVCKVVLKNGAPCYRLSFKAHHHHLVCAICGMAEDFARCTLDEIVGRLKQLTGYTIMEHRIEVYGICPSCQSELVEVSPGDTGKPGRPQTDTRI